MIRRWWKGMVRRLRARVARWCHLDCPWCREPVRVALTYRTRSGMVLLVNGAPTPDGHSLPMSPPPLIPPEATMLVRIDVRRPPERLR